MASLTLADMARRTVPGEQPMAKKPIAKVRKDAKAAKAKESDTKTKEPRSERWYGKGK
jgi:hypothetical protein